MKKIFSAVAALAAVMFVGCTTDIAEENVVVPSGDATTITLGIDDSRTALGDLEEDGSRKVFWNEGDQIVANGVTSATTTLSESKSFATFTFEDPNLVAPYNIFYPAACYKDATTVTLPAVREGAKSVLNAPMAGVHDGENATSLHHLTAVVRLQVKLPAESAHEIHNLLYVEVRGGNDEQMSGDFTIDYAAATLTPASTADADKVVTAECGHVLSSEEAHDVFIVVPAGEYAKGLQFRLIDRAGHYMDLKSGAKALNAGDILAMPVVEFAPTGTQIGVEIKSAEELVAFAKAYNAGDYWELSPFVVHLTEDIVFDDATNAAWEPIGNIFGADNKLGLDEGTTNYFHGHFDGNGHSIKNWVSSRPLFAYTGGGSVVENVVIDESCTLTANFKDEVEYFAAFVGYHRGHLINCTNNADITVSGPWSKDLYAAGLAARTVIGSIANCANNGDITFTSDVELVGKTVFVGGITGRISNEAGEVTESTNNGVISNAGTNMGERTDYKGFFGGIVGTCAGTVSNCTNNSTATISCGMKVPNHLVGGIAGNVEKVGNIENSTNHASFNYNPPRANDNEGRYLYIGGIAGCSEGTVIGNTNNGSISNSSGIKFVYMGGAVGYLLNNTPVTKNNTVSDKVVLISTGTSRYTGIGGLVGAMANGPVLDLKDDTGVIKATVKGGATENRANCFPGIGGVVGFMNNASTIKNVSNWQGTLHVDCSLKVNAIMAAYGGILGFAQAGGTVENCQTDGKLETVFTVALNGEIAIGGIVGVSRGNTNISNCTNNMELSMTSTVSSKKNPVYIGGIVGNGVDGNLSITNCNNTQQIWNRAYNNSGYVDGTSMKANYAGGIIGVYNLAAATTGTLTLTNCTVSAKTIAYRGFGGGIAGYTNNATISNCSVAQLVDCNGPAAGIACVAVNTAISKCTAKCDIKSNKAGSHIARMGGIVASLEGQSSISESAYFGAATITHGNAGPSYYGGISGYTASTASISNSKYGGTVGGVGITADNYGDYLHSCVAYGTGEATTPTVTGCNYWDGK